MSTYEYVRPADIEKESMRIIEGELQERGIEIPQEHLTVVKRVIHTTADFDYGENLKFTDRAVERAVEALKAAGEDAYIIGETVSGAQKGVELC